MQCPHAMGRLCRLLPSGEHPGQDHPSLEHPPMPSGMCEQGWLGSHELSHVVRLSDHVRRSVRRSVHASATTGLPVTTVVPMRLASLPSLTLLLCGLDDVMHEHLIPRYLASRSCNSV